MNETILELLSTLALRFHRGTPGFTIVKNLGSSEKMANCILIGCFVAPRQHYFTSVDTVDSILYEFMTNFQ